MRSGKRGRQRPQSRHRCIPQVLRAGSLLRSRHLLPPREGYLPLLARSLGAVRVTPRLLQVAGRDVAFHAPSLNRDAAGSIRPPVEGQRCTRDKSPSAKGGGTSMFLIEVPAYLGCLLL